MAQQETTRPTAHGTEGVAAIPDKLYFRIGEVAAICEVATYVLRFWESEFPQLKPNKGGTGQRLYRRRDVEMAMRIRTLLYEEGFTIPGARQTLKAEQRHKEPQLSLSIVENETPEAANRKVLRSLQNEMREILDLLGASPVQTAVQPIRLPRIAASAQPTARQGSDDLFG